MADRAESADERALRRELQELSKKREALDNSKRRGSGGAAGEATGRRSVFARLGGEPARGGGTGRQVQLKENNARGNASWRLGKRNNEDNGQNSVVKRQRLHSAVSRPEGAHNTERTETSRTSTSVTSPSANSARAQERKQRAVAPYAQKDGIARSRRMFGALMGHLGKAKRQIEKDTDLFKRQDTKQQEAEQREKMQSQDREKRARQEAEVSKLEALVARAELDRSEQIARAKLEHLQTVRKSESQSKFLVTIASPPLCYLPSKHTKETEDLVAASVEAHEAKMKALSQSHDEKLRKLEAEFATKLEQLREDLEAAKNGEKEEACVKEASREKKEDAMDDDDEDLDQSSKKPKDDKTSKANAREDRKSSNRAAEKASAMEVEDEDIVQESVSGSEADDVEASEGRRSNGGDNDDASAAAGEGVKSDADEEQAASPRATANGSRGNVKAAPTTEASSPSQAKTEKSNTTQPKKELQDSPRQPAEAAIDDKAKEASQEETAAKDGDALSEDAAAETEEAKEDAVALVDKMKVTELRAELKKRGLDVKGLKASLVQRLKEAMQDQDESK